MFGAVSGSVGCLGAMEAIKAISGLGALLAGALLTFDLYKISFQKIKIHRSPHCPICREAIS
ncbi:MAG: hypothetical protein C4527_08525 [Candidatus Omnitrophota bacterium]|nr:MAG: hypothetical protein C4527_08525 [Candidatus Omnitrophota bacterium]